MESSEILKLCNNSKCSHIIQNLGKEKLKKLKEYLETTSNVVIDTNDYNNLSHESIIKLLPFESKSDINQELNRLRLLTDIFKSFKRKKIILPFNTDYLNNYDRIMNCTTFTQFMDNYYIPYDYEELNRIGLFYKFKKMLSINIFISKEFNNIEMQKEFNSLLNNNKFKTNFFLESKGLITHIDSDNYFLKDYNTKILMKK